MSHDTCRSSVGLTPDSTRTVNSVAWRRSRQPVNRIVELNRFAVALAM